MKLDLLALMARTGGALAPGRSTKEADPVFDALVAALGAVPAPVGPVPVVAVGVQPEPSVPLATVAVHAEPSVPVAAAAGVPRDHAHVVAPSPDPPPSVHDHADPAPRAATPQVLAAVEVPATPTLPLTGPLQLTAPAVVRASVAPVKPRVLAETAPDAPVPMPTVAAPVTAQAPTAAPAVTSALPQLPATIVQQVVHLVHRGPVGEHTVTVHLHPAELGAVEVTVTVTHDATRVHLSAAHPDATAAVQQALPQLTSGLADAGLPQVDVQLGDRATPQPVALPLVPMTERRDPRGKPKQRTPTDPRRLLDVAL